MVTGNQLRDALISAANNIANKKSMVDSLNVFPVPDGDTGTNMSMTIGAAARELEQLKDQPVSEVARVAAAALLRGARGNSGVILSLLFRGFAKGLQGKDTATGADIASAMAMGVEAAYKAVMKPTEGTILTVSRCAAEKAGDVASTDSSVKAVFEAILDQAKETLAKTPDMLPILKKSGVVDAGGQGLVVILEGMMSFMQDGKIIEAAGKPAIVTPIETTETRSAAGESDQEIKFTYCTECIIDKAADSNDALAFRAFLESIGDSLVFVEDDSIIKVHVHTNDPGSVLHEAINYGTLYTVKIENMRNQHTSISGGAQAEPAPEPKSAEQLFPYAAVDPDTDYGFVAVAAGSGMHDLFMDLGVNNVVSGGQTMNPSTDDILAAIQATPAKTVFVLPNNKNIIMAAEQAAKLADRRVFVLQTRSIPQGITAMLAYDPEASASKNQLDMTHAISKVSTGQVTFAARDSDFDGKKIKQGELLAMLNGKLMYTGRDIVKICSRLAKTMVTKGMGYVTIYYGEDITEEKAKAVEQAVREKLPSDIEVTLVYGGQPVYYFVISAE